MRPKQKLCCAGLEDSSLSSRLQQGCPSYFKEDDKLYHTANGELRRAQTLQGTARQDITRSALDKLVRVLLLALLSCMTLHINLSDKCIVASRLQFCCVAWAGKLSSLICDTVYCDIELQSCILH